MRQVRPQHKPMPPACIRSRGQGRHLQEDVVFVPQEQTSQRFKDGASSTAHVTVMQTAYSSYGPTTAEPAAFQHQQKYEKPCISFAATEELAASERTGGQQRVRKLPGHQNMSYTQGFYLGLPDAEVSRDIITAGEPRYGVAAGVLHSSIIDENGLVHQGATYLYSFTIIDFDVASRTLNGSTGGSRTTPRQHSRFSCRRRDHHGPTNGASSC